MARRLKEAADEAPQAEHNSQARKQIMAECAQRMRAIKEQRKDLNEQAGDIRERLRNAGIDVKSWEAALRLSDMEDAEARDTYIDGLKEAFAALGIGEQGSLFIEAAEANGSAAAAREGITADADAMRKAGYAAGIASSEAKPPVPEDHPNHAVWMEGWQDGQAKLVKGTIKPTNGQQQPAAE